jgi:hypothetical protein
MYIKLNAFDLVKDHELNAFDLVKNHELNAFDLVKDRERRENSVLSRLKTAFYALHKRD